jgi:hypothetical protein
MAGPFSPRTRIALVIEFSTSSGQSVPLQVTLALLGNQYVAKQSGVEGQVAWVTKEPNATGRSPFYVKGAVAARVIGAEAELSTDSATWSRLKFSLPADGSTVSLFVAAEHLKNFRSPSGTVANCRSRGDGGSGRGSESSEPRVVERLLAAGTY